MKELEEIKRAGMECSTEGEGNVAVKKIKTRH